MKIFLITDIHYGLNANYPKIGGEDYVNSFGVEFDSFVPQLQELISQHDLVINLGDTIQDIDEKKDLENYQTVLKHLGTNIPVKNAVGNHDGRYLSNAELCGLLGESKLYYSFDMGGFHHVILYAYRFEHPGPYHIDAEQVEWLKSDLEVNKLPNLVYCHFPLDDQDLSSNYYFAGKEDRVFPDNKLEIRKILESSGRINGVFSGHTHFPSEQVINGITYRTIPSFSENDGLGKPGSYYASLDTENQNSVIINKLI